MKGLKSIFQLAPKDEKAPDLKHKEFFKKIIEEGLTEEYVKSYQKEHKDFSLDQVYQGSNPLYRNAYIPHVLILSGHFSSIYELKRCGADFLISEKETTFYGLFGVFYQKQIRDFKNVDTKDRKNLNKFYYDFRKSFYLLAMFLLDKETSSSKNAQFAIKDIKDTLKFFIFVEEFQLENSFKDLDNSFIKALNNSDDISEDLINEQLKNFSRFFYSENSLLLLSDPISDDCSRSFFHYILQNCNPKFLLRLIDAVYENGSLLVESRDILGTIGAYQKGYIFYLLSNKNLRNSFEVNQIFSAINSRTSKEEFVILNRNEFKNLELLKLMYSVDFGDKKNFLFSCGLDATEISYSPYDLISLLVKNSQESKRPIKKNDLQFLLQFGALLTVSKDEIIARVDASEKQQCEKLINDFLQYQNLLIELNLYSENLQNQLSDKTFKLLIEISDNILENLKNDLDLDVDSWQLYYQALSKNAVIKNDKTAEMSEIYSQNLIGFLSLVRYLGIYDFICAHQQDSENSKKLFTNIHHLLFFAPENFPLKKIHEDRFKVQLLPKNLRLHILVSAKDLKISGYAFFGQLHKIIAAEKSGEDIEKPDEIGRHPIFYAIANNQEDVVRFYLDKIKSPQESFLNSFDSHGRSIFQYCAAYSSQNIFEIVVKSFFQNLEGESQKKERNQQFKELLYDKSEDGSNNSNIFHNLSRNGVIENASKARFISQILDDRELIKSIISDSCNLKQLAFVLAVAESIKNSKGDDLVVEMAKLGADLAKNFIIKIEGHQSVIKPLICHFIYKDKAALFKRIMEIDPPISLSDEVLKSVSAGIRDANFDLQERKIFYEALDSYKIRSKKTNELASAKSAEWNLESVLEFVGEVKKSDEPNKKKKKKKPFAKNKIQDANLAESEELDKRADNIPSVEVEKNSSTEVQDKLLDDDFKEEKERKDTQIIAQSDELDFDFKSPNDSELNLVEQSAHKQDNQGPIASDLENIQVQKNDSNPLSLSKDPEFSLENFVNSIAVSDLSFLESHRLNFNNLNDALFNECSQQIWSVAANSSNDFLKKFVEIFGNSFSKRFGSSLSFSNLNIAYTPLQAALMSSKEKCDENKINLLLSAEAIDSCSVRHCINFFNPSSNILSALDIAIEKYGESVVANDSKAALANSRIVELLINRGADVNNGKQFFSESSFDRLIRVGNAKVVRHLIEKNMVDLNDISVKSMNDAVISLKRLDQLKSVETRRGEVVKEIEELINKVTEIYDSRRPNLLNYLPNNNPNFVSFLKLQEISKNITHQ